MSGEEALQKNLCLFLKLFLIVIFGIRVTCKPKNSEIYPISKNRFGKSSDFM